MCVFVCAGSASASTGSTRRARPNSRTHVRVQRQRQLMQQLIMNCTIIDYPISQNGAMAPKCRLNTCWCVCIFTRFLVTLSICFTCDCVHAQHNFHVYEEVNGASDIDTPLCDDCAMACIAVLDNALTEAEKEAATYRCTCAHV